MSGWLEKSPSAGYCRAQRVTAGSAGNRFA